MIGIKFYKPIENDFLTRIVMRTHTRDVEEQISTPVEREVTREVEEQIAVPVIRKEERVVEDPVYNPETGEYTYESKTVVVDVEDIEYKTVTKTVTETINDIEYKTIIKTITEEVPEQEEYENPVPNTFSKYREVALWCNSNNAYIEDKGDYYEVVAIPAPTKEELAAAALAAAKSARSAAVSSITVTVDGMVFDGDEVSQERMARTVTAATATGASMDDTTTWVLHDNTVATVTIRQLATALRLAGEEQTRLWTVPYEASYTPAEAA